MANSGGSSTAFDTKLQPSPLMMEHAVWIQAAEQIAVTDTAQRLGLTLMKANSVGPCPSCSAPERGSKDKRGPIGIRTDNKGWACHRCGAKGSGIDLASFALQGNKFSSLSSESKDKIRVWFEGEIRDGADIYSPPKPLRGSRPPTDQVRAFWSSSWALHQVDEDDAAIRFLESRNLNLAALAKSGVVRITPPRKSFDWPDWWPAGRSRTWRVVVPAFDCAGNFVSVHGRAVVKTESAPKTLWPKNYEASGLFMPNRYAVRMMKGDDVELDGVLFVEGLTDFLKCCAEVEDLNLKLAVLGGASGSFKHVGDLNIPSHVKIYIGTDPDKQGRAYASTIRSQLKQRKTFRLPLENFMGA